MFVSPHALKSLNYIKKIQQFTLATSPTIDSDEIDIIAFNNELSSLLSDTLEET